MKYKHFMIDLKTLATTADAVIMQIGVVGFNFEETSHSIRIAVGSGISRLADHALSIDLGEHGQSCRAVDRRTERRWKEQSKIMSDSPYFHHKDTGRTSNTGLHEALFLLSKFFKENAVDEDFRVWGNGSDFDIAMLTHAYISTCKQFETPWKFYNVRCMRTIKNMFTLDEDFKQTLSEIPHIAVEAAAIKVKMLKELLRYNPEIAAIL
jgi:hypothetical protein